MSFWKHQEKLLGFWIFPFFAGIFIGLGYTITKKTFFITIDRGNRIDSLFLKKGPLNDTNFLALKKQSSKKNLNKFIDANEKIKDHTLNSFSKINPQSKFKSSSNDFSKNEVPDKEQINISKKEIATFKKSQDFFQIQNVNEIFKSLPNP